MYKNMILTHTHTCARTCTQGNWKCLSGNMFNFTDTSGHKIQITVRGPLFATRLATMKKSDPSQAHYWPNRMSQAGRLVENCEGWNDVPLVPFLYFVYVGAAETWGTQVGEKSYWLNQINSQSKLAASGANTQAVLWGPLEIPIWGVSSLHRQERRERIYSICT